MRKKGLNVLLTPLVYLVVGHFVAICLFFAKANFVMVENATK